MPEVSEVARAAASAVLAEQPDHRRETFELRLERWWTDLLDGLSGVYPDAQSLAARVVAQAARGYAERDPELHRLDEQRTLAPDWFQRPDMVGYAAYADRFARDLPSVRQRIPYLRELGVTYLHLMPLLEPREGDNDGGYAVADYRKVRRDLGTVDDLRMLAGDLRRHGISLVLDLVLNHVAREHEWAVRARAGDPRYRGYFHVYPDRTEPDAYERTLPEVFPDFAPGSFTWDADVDGWVWTTFNSWQWDLDWSNPEVFCEFVDIVLFLANLGVEVLRLDAIAFLWKRLGTTCQNQPEVHAITQALRAVVRIACPAVAFKAEAIVGPDDLVHYLGRGRHHGKVSDLAYHNGLMVHVWSMLASREAGLAAHALRSLPPVPSTTAWITYVRCHDDIGWAIDDADAAAVGVTGPGHRAFLSDFYAGLFPGSFARGLVFQHNPASGDRRISGSLASLAGVEAALEQRDEAALSQRDERTLSRRDERVLSLAVDRVLLAHAIVAGWGGVPVLWMGDELGLLNDASWAAEPGHEDDNRWVHRPRFDDGTARQRHDAATVAGRLFAGLQRLLGVRRSLPHLHASVASQVPPLADPGVLPVLREHPLGSLLELFNVTDTWRGWPWYRLLETGLAEPWDALTGARVRPGGDGNVWLAPYQVLWLIDVPITPESA